MNLFGFVRLTASQSSKLVSVVLAFVVLFVGNVIAARHFYRWDVTEQKRYSLSAATVETLHDLPGDIEVWVLMGPGDPLDQSVKHLLLSYRAESDKVVVKSIDPDRDTVQFEDVKRRFHIEAGRSEDGRLVADAVIVVARGDKHWFITASDLFDVSGSGEGRAKPREEQALTLAIRSVIGGKKSTLCFTTGHGEMSLDDGTDRGLGTMKSVLEKDNFTTRAVDTTAPDAHEPFKDCDVAIVCGPRGPFKKDEAEMLRTYALSGGNILLGVSPITGDTKTGMQSAGLEPLLEPFGVKLEDALAVEVDPAMVLEGEGLGFYTRVRPHPVTSGLVTDGKSANVPRVKVKFARVLSHVSAGSNATNASSAPSLDLLVTSDKAFGVVDVSGAANWSGPPEKKPGDLAGPLILALASERAKVSKDAPHGPRLVAFSSASFFVGENWREPLADRGAALITDSAISWLAAKPQVLDIPEKQSVAAGLKVDEDHVAQIRNYVLIYMPLASIALGISIAFMRRASEGKPAPKKLPAKKSSAKTKSSSERSERKSPEKIGKKKDSDSRDDA